jgi:hypothetical protein
MALFRKPIPSLTNFEAIKSPIPLEHLDPSRRYDIYCYFPGEERLYENMRIVAIKTLDDISHFSSGIGGLLEIESSDGTRVMLPRHNIHMLCDHGSQPNFKLVRTWGEAINTRVSGIF